MVKNKSEAPDTPGATEQALYTKEQILQSERFKKYPDILAALMKDGDLYDVADIDRQLKEYLKRSVK